MRRTRIIFILLVVAAITVTIIRSSSPGGGSNLWFLGLLLLTLLYYYVGFVDKEANPFRFYAQGSFLGFLALTFLMAYLARVENNGLNEISEFITVYPNIEVVKFIPRTSEKTVQHWQIKTSDSIEHINKFYSDPANLSGWQLVMDEPMLILKKTGYKLTLLVADQPHSPLNSIVYHLVTDQ